MSGQGKLQLTKTKQAKPVFQTTKAKEQTVIKQETAVQTQKIKRQAPNRPLPPIPVRMAETSQLTGLEEDSLKKKDKEKLIEKRREDYNKIGKEMTLSTSVKIHETEYFTSKIGREDFKNRNAAYLTGEEKLEEITVDYVAQRVLESDFSNFENTDLAVRNVAATMAYEKFLKEYRPNPASDNPEELCQRIKATKEGVTALLNPCLRLGISLAVKSNDNQVSPEMKSFLLKLDEAMSTEVMYETITHIPKEEDVEAMLKAKEPTLEGQALQEKKRAMIEANDAQQIQIVKRLLLMQLSTFTKIKDDKSSEPWDKSMAVALSHCSRVVMTLPTLQKKGSGNSKEDQEALYNAIYKTKGENTAHDDSRFASTHNVFMRKVSKKGQVTSGEYKWYTGNYINQKGMNCAIGGLAQKGVAGKQLSNDGSCGHFYSMYKKAEKGYYGVMLMGLESDASGMVNQMGHKHTAKAKGEHASSLGGQRLDEVGKKYGGRQCDLTHLTARQIVEKLEELETRMKEYQERQRKGEGTEEFRQYLRKLTGVKFNPTI